MHPQNRAALIFVAFLMLFSLVEISSSQEEELIDSYTHQGVTQMWYYDATHPSTEDGKESAGGQTILINASQSYRLTKIAFRIGRNSAGNGTISVLVQHMNQSRIYGVNGTPAGEILAESEDYDLVTLCPTPGSWGYRNFSFTGDDQIILTNNVVYCFHLIFKVRIGGFLYINHQTNGQKDGNWYAWTGTDGGRWGYIEGYDQNFYLYGTPAGAAVDIAENVELAAILMASMWIIVFLLHLVYTLDSGNSEYFFQMMVAYTVAILVILMFATVALLV